MMQKLFRQNQKFLNFKNKNSIVTYPSINKVEQGQANFKHQINVLTDSCFEQQKTNISKFEQEHLKKAALNWNYGEENANLKAYMKKDEDAQKNMKNIRNLASKCARNLHSNKVQDIDIQFPASFNQNEVSEFLNAFYLSNYQFKVEGDLKKGSTQTSEEYEKASAKRQKQRFQPVQNINVLSENFDATCQDFQFRIIQAKAALYARELGNQRANVGNTQYFLEECTKILQDHPKLQMQHIRGKQLESNGLRLHYAVGKGSQNEPMAINLQYNGNPDSKEYISLVGKGLTFDAGGLNIKPTGFMETMYMDKQGACNVLGILRGVLESNMKINLTCSIGLAENFISSDCYRPSDIITAYNGLTVEIGNTDAEGRLVLADVICWTNDLNKNITKMIEFSTLTGACAVALGHKTAGVFSNNDELASDLIQAGKNANEQMWRLPVFDDHRESMKGKHSDLNNTGKSRYGGASQAAAFLERFFNNKAQWAHIDIAGPADTAAQNGVYSSGSTAFGVETLLEYLNQQSKQQK